MDHFKHVGFAAYRQPHLQYLDHSGSPCPAQSGGQRKRCAAVFFACSSTNPIRLVFVFEPIADELPAAVAFQLAGNDDLTETFAAIGSAVHKTNSQMKLLTKDHR
jgi:hypothetical protein